MNPFLEDSLKRKLLFFTGKGGVGKTTLTWATALWLRKQNKKVAVCSWDPFHELEPFIPIPNDLKWIPLETFSAFHDYVIHILKFDKIYNVVFNNKIFRTFISATPGVSETVVAGKIMDLTKNHGFDHVLVDLPSSGHAISFFKSPLGVHDLFKRGFVHKESEKIRELYTSEQTQIHLVTLPEELPVTECLALKKDLESIANLPIGHTLINFSPPVFDVPEGQNPNKDIQRLLDQYRWDLENFEAAKKQIAEHVCIPRMTEFTNEAITEGIVDSWGNA